MPGPNSLHDRGLQLLRKALRDGAEFRDGQWEAIEALVDRRAHMLLVQRTGWGKSIVYFMATRLLRDRGAGPTLLVSPLLALMRNQIEAAAKLGIKALTINSTNRKEWEEVEKQVRANAVDALLISPERFANEQFQIEVLLPVARQAGLFVVDEAHCISDWGHDFRPDYRRIIAVLKRLPVNIPICATTATANNRVVADVVSQLGQGIEVVRGPIMRESLRLQNVPLPNSAAKLGWLGQYLPKFAGSGIVYALTVRWTERIARWLQAQKPGINAAAYHAQLTHEERLEREEQLRANRIKVLVATTALGMGYDKPDLGFVVHFHQAASVIHYYQQVGRAGRAISQAYGIMLAGGDDRDIADYFIEQAFPPEREVARILEALERSDNGLTKRELEREVNLSATRIELVLKSLAVDNPAPIAYLDDRWAATPHIHDIERRRATIAHRTEVRRAEQAQMDAYLMHDGCLMEFLGKALDDPAAGKCGRCANCQGKPDALRQVAETPMREALAFLQRSDVPIEPRKLWQAGAHTVRPWKGAIAPALRAEPGRALCILGDPGLGDMVLWGKYHEGKFGDELVEELASLVRGWNMQPRPAWLTCVPSTSHPTLLPELAQRLATRLSIPFVAAVRRVKDAKPQKDMENSWQQAHNLDGVFQVERWQGLRGPVVLLDDIVDSRWTFTIVAALLREAGSGPVFPFALAASR